MRIQIRNTVESKLFFNSSGKVKYFKTFKCESNFCDDFCTCSVYCWIANFLNTVNFTYFLFVGVGPVFCQGVDLLYLVNDRPEKRKEAAAELATG